jgi:hypothetical protein
VFVATVLLALVIVDLACIVWWGRDIPLAEDWVMVPPLTGHERDMLAWLWSQNNEHRLALPRLAYWLLLEAFPDFRSGMVLSQLLLATLAAALVRTAWIVRGGKSSYADLFFPLALLHLGHWSNLMWGWQVNFVIAITLAGIVLCAIVRADGLLSGARAAVAAIGIVLLPLSGAIGLVLSGPLVLWLAWQATVHLVGRSPACSRRTGWFLATAAALTAVLCLVYFVGYERPSWSPPAPDPSQFAKALVKYLAYGFGPGARLAWGLSALLAVTVLGAAVAVLVRGLRSAQGAEKHRAVGIAAFMAACAALSLSVAWGRGGDPGMPDRYSILAVISLIGAFFVSLLYGSGRARALIPAVLTLILLCFLPLNLRTAGGWRNWYVQGMQAVEHDIAAKVSIDDLARRHRVFLMHWSEDRLRDGMMMLRDAGIGPFSTLPRDVGQPATPSKQQ